MDIEHCDSCHNASLVKKPNKKIVVKGHLSTIKKKERRDRSVCSLDI